MNYRRLLIIFSLTSLLVMSCGLVNIIQQNPASPASGEAIESAQPVETTLQPTADPLAAAKNCLVNTWEITGLSDYVVAAIPADMAEEYDLQYKGTNGKANFTLSPDGRVTMQAEQLELLFEAKASIISVPVTVKLDGQAVGQYSVQGNTLTTYDMDTSGLTASAQAFGSEVVEPAKIIGAIPLVKPPFNTAEYTCAGDTLQLKVASYPENVPPLTFHPVK